MVLNLLVNLKCYSTELSKILKLSVVPMQKNMFQGNIFLKIKFPGSDKSGTLPLLQKQTTSTLRSTDNDCRFGTYACYWLYSTGGRDWNVMNVALRLT